MAELNTYQCDICSALRTESNYWFMARGRTENYFEVFPWSINATKKDLMHICSEQCLHKALSRAINPNKSSDNLNKAEETTES